MSTSPWIGAERPSMDLSDKTAMFVDTGLFTHIAITLTKFFKKVLMFNPTWKTAFPSSTQLYIGEGFKGIERVEHFWDRVGDADIFIFPDIGHGDLQEELIRQGKLVWGSRKADEIEMDRWTFKHELLRAVGLPVQPMKKILGIEKMREYLQDPANDGKFVKISTTRGDMESCKHYNYNLSREWLDELQSNLGPLTNDYEFIIESPIVSDMELGFDGWVVDGKYPEICGHGVEVKDAGYLGVVMPYKDLPQPILAVNEKMSQVWKEYGYRGWMSTEIRVTKDGEPYFLDTTCFSDDTEILTDEGWKFFSDLNKTEKVATLNPRTKHIEYHQPYAYQSFRFDGDMVSISNKEQTIECLVTPNHSIWRTDRYGAGLFSERADQLTDKGFIPRTGTWIGQEQEYFVLPEYHHEWTSGRYNGIFKIKHCDPIAIRMDDWLAFLGIFLAEGSVGGANNSIVNISQFKYVNEMQHIIEKLPFHLSRTKGGWQFASTQMGVYLSRYGICNEKYVPDYVKQLSARQIKIFLGAFQLGDGGRHKGQNNFYTTSKRLADDIQELIFKTGSIARIDERKVANTPMTINGKTYIRNHDGFVISELAIQNKFWFETGCRKKRYINNVEYHGMVHDVTVRNHILYVRRNGKPFWSGNCRAGSPPSQTMMELYGNWGEIIWKGAQGQLVKPQVKAQYGAQAFLYSERADKKWMAYDLPDGLRDNVKFSFACEVDGIPYTIPQNAGMAAMASIVAVDDDLFTAIKKLVKYADKVKANGLDCRLDSIPKAIQVIHDAKKKGYGFGTSRIPTVEEVARVVI